MTTTREVDAHVDYTDEEGRKHEGTFTLKTSLSARDESEVGRRRRAILGPVPVTNDGDALDYFYASTQAELNVRATSAPDWWKKEQGDDLKRSTLDACGSAMRKALEEHSGKAKKSTEEAGKELRAGAEKGKA